MTSFTLTKRIDAPRETVFRLASDFRNAADHIQGITKVEMLTDGPVAQGTRFQETRIVFKREATEEMTVSAYDPPSGYALDCESCGCHYHTEFRFTANGSGTDVEMRFDVKPLTFFAKVMGFLMRPMMKMCLKETGKDLDDLKAVAEGGTESGATATAS